MINKIYKQGQGYYTRMVSAVWFGAIAGLGIVWGVEQTEVLVTDIGNSQLIQNIQFIQAGVAVLLIAILGGLIYYFIGFRPSTCEFLISSDAEMKKVNWPSRREALGSTWVVIAATLICVLMLFVADIIFATFFSSIDVLESSPFSAFMGGGGEN